MVVYSEVIFISNFFTDIFLYLFTLTLLKSKINKFRVISAGIIGGICSAVLPYMWSYTSFIKIGLLIILPAVFRRNGNFKSYTTTLAAFLAVTLFIGGAVYALKIQIGGVNKIYIGYGLIPVLFSISGMAGLYFYKSLKGRIKSEINKNKNVYTVEISDGYTKIKKEAYFDSGNRVYADNGEPVVIVDKEIYNKFDGDESDVIIRTVNGITSLKCKFAEIKIYFNRDKNMIYKTAIAKAPYMSSDYNIILHSDMCPEEI